MNELSGQDRQSVISLFQEKINTLPAPAKDPEICKFFDMLARSEELGFQREALDKQIEANREPFLILFHAGSVETNPDHYVAFQVEAYKRHWVVRAGVLDPSGRDFLVAHHSVEVFYHDYEKLSTDTLVNELFGAVQALLSGELAVLESSANDRIYAAELLLRSGSTRAIDTVWFGDKKLAEPRKTTLQSNNLLKSEGNQAPTIFSASKDGKPLFNGRVFTSDDNKPLTLEEYKQFNGKLVTNVAKKLSGLSLGFTSLFALSLVARQMDGGNDLYALIGVGAAFLVLLGLMIYWFPQIAKMFLAAWIAPIVIAGAVFMAFVGVGSLYDNIPALAEAVDGDNTALSMVVVLGWFTIGFVAAGFAFFKSSKYLTARFEKSVESRRK